MNNQESAGPSSFLSEDDGEQLSFHRRASACLPHGDGIEIAFSDLPVKLSPVPPHTHTHTQLSKESLFLSSTPNSSYLGSGRTAQSSCRLQLSLSQ